jgi:hypothetical protein
MIKDLLKLNVNEHTEKKGNLTYLSWAWAWDLALKADEQATYKVEMFGDKCYMDINGTAMVFVTVTIFGKSMTCQLPVMDFRNKAITNPDAFAVNTAIMRCMTKALSLHGLGLYIYSGEDLPEEAVAKIKPTDGALVTEKQKSMLHDVATSIRDHFEQGDIIGAVEEVMTVTDVEEKTYLWSLLDSKIRSAIKNQLKESK